MCGSIVVLRSYVLLDYDCPVSAMPVLRPFTSMADVLA